MFWWFSYKKENKNPKCMVKKGYELTNCALHINMDGNSINMDNN